MRRRAAGHALLGAVGIALIFGGVRTGAHAGAEAPSSQPTHHGRRAAFHVQRVAIDLGAPLLALAAADVDGDGAAELVALTTDEVVVLTVKKGAAVVRGRFALDEAAPVPRPRTPVGALVVTSGASDGAPEILAKSSEHAHGVKLAWQAGALKKTGVVADFPICAVREAATPDANGATPALGPARVSTAALASGAHWFPKSAVAWDGGATPALPERFLAAGCGPSEDAGMWLGAVDGAGTLWVYAPGHAAATTQLAGSGVAFAFADVDGDGRVDAITSNWDAPGDGDRITVRALGDDGTARLIWRSDALHGGIAGIAVGDLDGGSGAPSIVAGARVVGSTRVDLWVVK